MFSTDVSSRNSSPQSRVTESVVDRFPFAGISADPFGCASHVTITPSCFAAMGIPVLAGHGFPPDIKAGDAHVIVVNEALAKKFRPRGPT